MANEDDSVTGPQTLKSLELIVPSISKGLGFFFENIYLGCKGNEVMPTIIAPEISQVSCQKVSLKDKCHLCVYMLPPNYVNFSNLFLKIKVSGTSFNCS